MSNIPTIWAAEASADESRALRTAPQVQALISFLEYEAQPMIVLDTEYNILAANTAYRRQFGTVDKPYIGHKCYRISHHYDVPCDQAGEHCPMKKAFELKGPDRVLHIHHTPRGPEHVDVELRPILDADREVVAYVERLSTVRNASARPSAEGLVGRSCQQQLNTNTGLKKQRLNTDTPNVFHFCPAGLVQEGRSPTVTRPAGRRFIRSHSFLRHAPFPPGVGA